MKNRARFVQGAALVAALILFVFGLIPSQSQDARWQLKGTVTAINCLDNHITLRSGGGILWIVVFADPADCQKVKPDATIKVVGVPAANGQKTLTAAVFKGIVATDQAAGVGPLTVTGT